jgi:hypothetical protein
VNNSAKIKRHFGFSFINVKKKLEVPIWQIQFYPR